MKRRRFVYIAAIGSSALSFPFSGCETGDKRLGKPVFLYSILSKDEIIQIGKSYRNKFPDESTSDSLISRLQGNKDGWLSGPEIEQMIKSDFEKGTTLEIEGWILSKTEARQSALYSL